MKKMKLFMLGMMMAMGGTAMAQQVTLTANDATDKKAGWTMSIQTPKQIAGWQMEIALPEGITIPSKELKVGDATFTEYDVTLPARYGAKYKAVGTPTDNGVFLFFIPVAETYTANDFQITGTEGEACTITLQTEGFEGPATVAVTNICASDADGNSTDLAGADVTFALNHPVGDASSDFLVDGSDIQLLINHVVADTFVESADVVKDGTIDGSDIQKTINVILE